MNKSIRLGESYAIGKPISNPYFGAILGINKRGSVLGSTVCPKVRVSIAHQDSKNRLLVGNRPEKIGVEL